MSHHKLFCHIKAETRIIGLLRCLEHVDLQRYVVAKGIRKGVLMIGTDSHLTFVML